MKTSKFRTVRGYQRLLQKTKLLTPSMEDYLEMICRHCLKEGYVRINTLAETLNVQASSATKMVQKLAELELLDYEKYGIIRLTTSGRQLGLFLLNRHKTIEKFLTNLGATDTLLAETEMIEHNVSLATLQKLELLNEFFAAHPQILRKFQEFCRQQ